MRTLTALAASVVALLCLSEPSLADYASAPATGAAIVTHGRFTNIYFWPDPSQETWDQHLATLRSQGVAVDASETTEKIDAFVSALTQSHYFDALMQYRTMCILCTGDGIHPPSYLGDETTVQKCVDAAVKDVGPGPTLGYGTLRSFANCEQSVGGNPSDQVNLILSPEYNIAGFDLLGNATGMCTTGWHTDAFHGFGSFVPNFTVDPTLPLCNAHFNDLTEAISHEMVETVSDPAGLGYIHETTVARVIGDVGSQFNEGELGDICEAGGSMNPKSDDKRAHILVDGYEVSKYWSNLDNTCVPLIPSSASAQTRDWVDASNLPMLRFNSNHNDWTSSINAFYSDSNSPVQQLVLYVTTGGNALRGGDQNVTVRLGLADKMLSFPNVNENQEWNTGETHAVLLQVPPGTMADRVVSLTLHTQFNSYSSDYTTNGDWDVAHVQLIATLGAPTGPVIPTPGPTFPPPVDGIDPSKFYAIIARNSGKALDVRGGPCAVADWTQVQQWQYVGGLNQQWQFIPIKGGQTWQILARSSRKALQIQGGLPVNGAPVQQFRQGGNPIGQYWVMVQVGGYYKIQAATAGGPAFVLDVQGGPSATADGVAIQVWQDTASAIGVAGAANQQWQLTPVAGVSGLVNGHGVGPVCQ